MQPLGRSETLAAFGAPAACCLPPPRQLRASRRCMQKPSFCAATIPFQTLLVVVLLLAQEGLLLLCVPPLRVKQCSTCGERNSSQEISIQGFTDFKPLEGFTDRTSLVGGSTKRDIFSMTRGFGSSRGDVHLPEAPNQLASRTHHGLEHGQGRKRHNLLLERGGCVPVRTPCRL